MHGDDIATSGRDHYAGIFAKDVRAEAEWLRLGAEDKADSISMLLADRVPVDVLCELGCGTGAVLLECVRRNLARRYIGIDYSVTALDYLRERLPAGVTVEQADIMNKCAGLSRAGIDVLVISHVLEHLEQPRDFLRSAVKQFPDSLFIIEVPLENLSLARLKVKIRGKRVSAAGHVQFFDFDSIRALLAAEGFGVLATRAYAPVLKMNAIMFAADRNSDGRAALIGKIFTGWILPWMFQPIWKRCYYAHLAILCKPIANAS